jgi:hypothetical protein
VDGWTCVRWLLLLLLLLLLFAVPIGDRRRRRSGVCYREGLTNGAVIVVAVDVVDAG